MLKNHIKTAEIILSALPYIQKFRGQTFVVKYGGSAQSENKLKNDFARDIVLLQLVGIKVVIVHGGGKKINSFLDKLNIKSEFKNGVLHIELPKVHEDKHDDVKKLKID